jgi:kanamycin kinase
VLLDRVPPSTKAVPVSIADLAGGPVTLVWENEVGGLTGRVDGDEPRFIKWNPLGSGESLAAEAERLRWLAGRHPAPIVVDFVVAGDAELLVTRALPGRSAVDPFWQVRPNDAVCAIAAGLRLLHALPTADCPFEWDVASRLRAAPENVALADLMNPPPIDRLVVCHGDPCAPNTLLDENGFVANVDFGRLGLADRWADLAVATMSLGRNYENYDEQLFWDAYGIEPDAERIAYYRALWTAT